mmetsp:Transcript_13142/g.26656  ORF Transcript_13142/g.26656 Transcript_13142/m.26656 type:complete len:143 (+) Transcript_13142:1437-1865(+)
MARIWSIPSLWLQDLVFSRSFRTRYDTRHRGEIQKLETSVHPFTPIYSTFNTLIARKFSHEMYVQGCNSGLFYSAFSLSAGDDWPLLERYNQDRRVCMSTNAECKVWYRSDYRQVKFPGGDLTRFQTELSSIIDKVKSARQR